jgi:hypothetical protein
MMIVTPMVLSSLSTFFVLWTGAQKLMPFKPDFVHFCPSRMLPATCSCDQLMIEGRSLRPQLHALIAKSRSQP